MKPIEGVINIEHIKQDWRVVIYIVRSRERNVDILQKDRRLQSTRDNSSRSTKCDIDVNWFKNYSNEKVLVHLDS